MIFRDLMNDPLVRPDSLSVEVCNGEVVLGGTVDNLFAKLSAERNVRGQLGVGRVNNRLTVTRNPEITDDELSVMVSDALKQNCYVYQFEFKVDVRDGRVSLGGTVRTGFEKNQAIKAVSLVEGVTAVSANIRVIDKPLLSYQDLLEPSSGDYLEFQSALDSIMLPAGADTTLTISIDVDWLKEGLEPQHPNCFNFLGASIYLIRRFILKDTTLAK